MQTAQIESGVEPSVNNALSTEPRLLAASPLAASVSRRFLVLSIRILEAGEKRFLAV